MSDGRNPDTIYSVSKWRDVFEMPEEPWRAVGGKVGSMRVS